MSDNELKQCMFNLHDFVIVDVACDSTGQHWLDYECKDCYEVQHYRVTKEIAEICSSHHNIEINDYRK